MATKTLITPEEYLKMSFDRPGPDYLDGELKERHLGSTPHFEAQERILELLRSLKQSHSLFAYPEVTLKISPTRYRVADVAAFRARPPEKYPSAPPVLIVEVVSEDDRHVDIQAKLAEYHTWGVKHVWLVDPWTKNLSVFDAAGFRDVATLELPEYGVKVTPADIFPG